MNIFICSFLTCFVAHPAFPPEYTVNPEYLEREIPKVYPGYSGVYPYHPFSLGFAINESSSGEAPSPPGVSLQRGFRHIPSNCVPGNATTVSVSSTLLITCANTTFFSCFLFVEVTMKSPPAYQFLHSILIHYTEENISK